MILLHSCVLQFAEGYSVLLSNTNVFLLQVRADRIQSDIELLLKALTERCKRHGIDVKSAAMIELPVGISLTLASDLYFCIFYLDSFCMCLHLLTERCKKKMLRKCVVHLFLY